VFELKPLDQWKPPGLTTGTMKGVRFYGDDPNEPARPIPPDRRFTLTDQIVIERTRADNRFTLISETP